MLNMKLFKILSNKRDRERERRQNRPCLLSNLIHFEKRVLFKRERERRRDRDHSNEYILLSKWDLDTI